MWAYIIGAFCLLYFAAIVVFGGVGSNFYLIWAVMGISFLSYGFGMKSGWLIQHFPVFFRRGFYLCFLLGLVLFLVVEGLIFSGFSQKGRSGLDYIVVLGAQVKPGRPSKVLAMRLDTAYDYLIQNENTVAIVSGGQGSNEPESEAQCMKRYLVEKGIAPQRVIMEDQSVNTNQNLTFSAEKMSHGKEQAAVGIVTNNFHVFRSVSIAKRLGYGEVCGIAAPSYLPLQPNNMLREFFGVMKDYLVGNL